MASAPGRTGFPDDAACMAAPETTRPPGESGAGRYNPGMGERYLKSVRLLAECLQGFERLTAAPVRRFGLTHAQFDIIATLGNTPGMSYKQLGERTLITKGTLTGVIERLEQKGIVERARSSADKRSFSVRLSPAGDALFRQVFPAVVAHGKQLFADYGDSDFEQLDRALGRLRARLDEAGVTTPAHGSATRTTTKDNP
ncbi:MarR family winged helix-turn-helix transcriptional regulator [uncultured Massilia sp.]|uniref:MarR family winged helix-turn-helix transcriptional regulator n=1 Tax=uncultured Massilia sp. TaxID=169973 RepID=UPI0035A32093